MIATENVTATEALARLRAGNRAYLTAGCNPGDVSPALRLRTLRQGQRPYAVVITCSDSRVIPESIFSAGLGELFVIRVAGNVIDNHQLGSVEYAAAHLNTRLILLMGHTCCGAVDAAIAGDVEGYIKFVTDEIKLAIGAEREDYRACCKNIRRGMEKLRESPALRRLEREQGLQVVGAVYDTGTGRVEFLP